MSNKDSQSRTSNNRHRELLFLRRDDYCRRTFGVPGDTYQTVSVLRLFSFITLFFNPNDVAGTCGAVCSEVCNHQPCTDDFVSPDDALCECFSNGASQCKDFSFCAEETDTCACNTGYEGNPLTGCVDINECRNALICGSGGTCVNVPGSFECECNVGYQDTSPAGGCVDINECTVSPPCGPNSICTNTVGSFQCACRPGYIGTPPNTPCTDINECSRSPTPCGPNAASCNNIDGSYRCTCNQGYKDTSPTGGCVNINECTEGGNNCDSVKEACTDTVGSFSCACRRGYQGQPGACVDVDECTVAPPCGPNAACTNTIGNYTCACNAGFLGGGPPQCRKLNAYEKCPGPNSDCSTGLECSITSRSDPGTSCCPTLSPTDPAYTCQVDKRCCSGAYTAGQACPSGLELDCRDELKCARRSAFDSTQVCCQTVVTVGTLRTCLF